MNRYEIILRIPELPEIQTAAIKTVYLEFSGALFAVLAGSYLAALGVQKLYIEEEYVDAGIIPLVFLSIPIGVVVNWLKIPFNISCVDSDDLEDYKEKSEAYDEMFEVEE